MDLSVVATPLYLGSMVYENRVLKARAATAGPTPADYDRPDTRTSLTMGVASLMVPITQYALTRVVPGKGRAGKALVGFAASAIAVTTVADRVARRADARRDARTARRARQVASVGGVAAVASTVVGASAAYSFLSSTKRQWAKGQHRDLGTGVRAWTLAMVGWDLAYYCNHRLQHEVRAMWAIHVVHHSSEHYNLSTALRQPVSAFGAFVPYSWLARLGVRPALIEHSRAINLIYQYWIHTDTIRSLGASEAVLNTPSHHRVHHGSNRRYLDRNHAGILIVWDRLFGTFQPELADDPVVYGLTKNIHTFNPLRVITHEYRDMFADVASAENWHDRVSYVLRGPGWAYRKRDERLAAA